MINAGMDSTEDFVAIHSTKATKMLERYYIGDLDTDSSITAPSAKGRDDDSVKKYALDPKKKISFQLQSKTVLSHDSFIL